VEKGKKNSIHATNLPWVIDEEEGRGRRDVKTIALMNELARTGHSLYHLHKKGRGGGMNQGKTMAGATRAYLVLYGGSGQSIHGRGGRKGVSRWVPIKAAHKRYFSPLSGGEKEGKRRRAERNATRQSSW